MAKRADIARQHIIEAANYIAQRKFDQFTGQLNYGDESRFDSPIEEIFFAWFCAENWAGTHGLDLVPQFEVKTPNKGKTYRFDFVVVGPNREETKVAVELDGHAFHEKTRAQVTYRNKRDRDLQAIGWKIFHFSYDELISRPLECVGEVLWPAYQAIWAREDANGVAQD